MKVQVKNGFITWLGIVITLTIIFGTIYAVTQQAWRQGINGPLSSFAIDAASQLAQGADPSQVAGVQHNLDSGGWQR